jgi:uncharacterized membrane protein
MTPHELGEQWRHGSAGHLRQRRGVVSLALAAAGSMGLITLYQTGLIRRVPEPALPGLDAERVNGSDEAYARFETPDAALGLVSYAVTVCLASAGGPDRAREKPWLPLALAAKVGFDAATAVKLTRDEAMHFRAYCLWCLLATGATLSMVPLVLPEAREALHYLSGRAGAGPGSDCDRV